MSDKKLSLSQIARGVRAPAEPHPPEDQTDAVLRRLRTESPPSPASSPGWGRWIAAGTVAAVFIAAIGASLWMKPSGADTDFAVRATQNVLAKDVGLAIERLGPHDEPIRLISETPLQTQERLLFSYRQLSSDYRFLWIVAKNEGELLWLLPESAGPGLEIDSGRANRRIPTSVELELRPGAIKFYGIFAREALSKATLQEVMEDPDSVTPKDAAVVRSLSFEVEDAS